MYEDRRGDGLGHLHIDRENPPGKHIPTAAEQALYDQQQARRQRAADQRNWDHYSSLPYGTPWPEYDTVYTGQLALVADGWSDGLRKT